MCLRRLNYDRKELERRREESQDEVKGNNLLLWFQLCLLKHMKLRSGVERETSICPEVLSACVPLSAEHQHLLLPLTWYGKLLCLVFKHLQECFNRLTCKRHYVFSVLADTALY